jgi:hypothetical protein
LGSFSCAEENGKFLAFWKLVGEVLDFDDEFDLTRAQLLLGLSREASSKTLKG